MREHRDGEILGDAMGNIGMDGPSLCFHWTRLRYHDVPGIQTGPAHGPHGPRFIVCLARGLPSKVWDKLESSQTLEKYRFGRISSFISG